MDIEKESNIFSSHHETNIFMKLFEAQMQLKTYQKIFVLSSGKIKKIYVYYYAFMLITLGISLITHNINFLIFSMIFPFWFIILMITDNNYQNKIINFSRKGKQYKNNLRIVEENLSYIISKKEIQLDIIKQMKNISDNMTVYSKYKYNKKWMNAYLYKIEDGFKKENFHTVLEILGIVYENYNEILKSNKKNNEIVSYEKELEKYNNLERGPVNFSKNKIFPNEFFNLIYYQNKIYQIEKKLKNIEDKLLTFTIFSEMIIFIVSAISKNLLFIIYYTISVFPLLLVFLILIKLRNKINVINYFYKLNKYKDELNSIKDKLIPVISQNKIQFNILINIKLMYNFLLENKNNDSNSLLSCYEDLKISFIDKDYLKSYEIIQLINQKFHK